MCATNGAKILCVEKHIFEKLTSENAPQGIITVCEFYENKHSFSATVKAEKKRDDEFDIYFAINGKLKTLLMQLQEKV